MRDRKIVWTDVVAGGLTLLVGLFAMWEGSRYGIGELRRMDAGYFPFALGAMLALLALAILAGALRPVPSATVPLSWRGLVAVPSAMLAFMLLIQDAGIIPAVASAILIAASADRRLRLHTIAILAVAGSLACAAIFIYLLGLPLSAFGGE